MKDGRIKAKDIPDDIILEAMDRTPGKWHCCWDVSSEDGLACPTRACVRVCVWAYDVSWRLV